MEFGRHGVRGPVREVGVDTGHRAGRGTDLQSARATRRFWVGRFGANLGQSFGFWPGGLGVNSRTRLTIRTGDVNPAGEWPILGGAKLYSICDTCVRDAGAPGHCAHRPPDKAPWPLLRGIAGATARRNVPSAGLRTLGMPLSRDGFSRRLPTDSGRQRGKDHSSCDVPHMFRGQSTRSAPGSL